MSEINTLSQALRRAVLPVIDDHGADVVIPALLTLAVALTMEALGDDAVTAADRAIRALEDAKRDAMS